MKPSILITFFSLVCLEFVTAFPLQAAQYRHCYNVKRYRTVRDVANHPNAYTDGYREGIASAKKGETYEPRSSGGEFARGFDDGYYGRPATGQQYTIPDRQEAYNSQECRLYNYNENDPIDQILEEVLTDFERDLKREWNIN